MVHDSSNGGRGNFVDSIESLASAELMDWFVWDNLVMPAFERAEMDRSQAIMLLSQAITRLASANESALPPAPLQGPAAEL